MLNFRACILDYHWDGWWYQFDWLCSGIQHEVSHLFGVNHCDEEWCVMNYGYMPYEEYAGWWIIKWKTNETWATKWGLNCKNRLIQAYNGITFTYMNTYIYYKGNAIVYERLSWTETYYHWNLTSLIWRSFFVRALPCGYWYAPRGLCPAP